MQDITDSSKLDYCKVHLKPSRDMDLEYFSSPASLIASMDIDFEHDKEVRFENNKFEVKWIKPRFGRVIVT